MATDIKEILKDPDFIALPPSQKHVVLSKADPEYQKLPAQERARVLMTIHNTPQTGFMAGFSGKIPAEKQAGVAASIGRTFGMPGDIAQAALSGPQGPAEEKMVQSHPIMGRLGLPVKRMLVDPAIEEGKKALDPARSIPERIGHGAAAAVPLFGPQIASIGERYGRGDTSGATADLLTLLIGGKLAESPELTGKALDVAGDVGAKAARAGKVAASHIVEKTGKATPALAAAAGGLAGSMIPHASWYTIPKGIKYGWKGGKLIGPDIEAYGRSMRATPAAGAAGVPSTAVPKPPGGGVPPVVPPTTPPVVPGGGGPGGPGAPPPPPGAPPGAPPAAGAAPPTVTPPTSVLGLNRPAAAPPATPPVSPSAVTPPASVLGLQQPAARPMAPPAAVPPAGPPVVTPPIAPPEAPLTGPAAKLSAKIQKGAAARAKAGVTTPAPAAAAATPIAPTTAEAAAPAAPQAPKGKTVSVGKLSTRPEDLVREQVRWTRTKAASGTPEPAAPPGQAPPASLLKLTKKAAAIEKAKAAKAAKEAAAAAPPEAGTRMTPEQRLKVDKHYRQRLTEMGHTPEEIANMPFADRMARVKEHFGEQPKGRPSAAAKAAKAAKKAPESISSKVIDEFKHLAEDESGKPQLGSTIKLREISREQPRPDYTYSMFEGHDAAGKALDLKVSITDNGTVANVESVSNIRKGAESKALGASAMFDVANQIKAEFPTVKQIGGFRVGGLNPERHVSYIFEDTERGIKRQVVSTPSGRNVLKSTTLHESRVQKALSGEKVLRQRFHSEVP